MTRSKNLFAVAALLLLTLAGCSKPAQMPGKPWHHTTEGFRNPVGSPERNSWTDRLPWLLNKFAAFAGPGEKQVLPPGHVLPKKQVLDGLKSTAGQNTVTWLGHMTALLRLDGKTILTDTWLTSHASPIRPLGPKRYVPPALTVDELPPIDFVVISHSHFDHLDLPTIETLKNRHSITAMVPLGLGKHFRERGYRKVIELDWEKSAESQGINFTAPPPVIHWSKRSLFATNDTLWACWAIEGRNEARIYFGGDAEYGPVYADIAKCHGGFDIALLSIGAFLPRIVMNGAHCVPEDCLKIGHDLQCISRCIGARYSSVTISRMKP